MAQREGDFGEGKMTSETEFEIKYYTSRKTAATTRVLRDTHCSAHGGRDPTPKTPRARRATAEVDVARLPETNRCVVLAGREEDLDRASGATAAGTPALGQLDRQTPVMLPIIV